MRTRVLSLWTMAVFLGGWTIPTAVWAADEIHWSFVGPTSVTFDWRGSENTIRYGPTSAYGQAATAVTPSPVPFSSSGPFWEAKLTNLLPNTVYHYSIGSGADHRFRTPIPRGSSDFTVYAEGDIGDAGSYPRVTDVQALIAGDLPTFIIALGDMSYGNAHGQAAVDRHYNDVMVWSQDAAYMPAWGNHEWDKATDDLRNYKGRFDLPNPQTSPGSPSVSCCGEDWSWFDYGNVRFISYPEPWSGAWADWNTKAKTLMDEAQSDPAIKFIVTFGHRPAYSTGHHAGDGTFKGYLDALGSSHSKYVLNVNGHSHNYERSFPQNGVTHVTAGIGGSTLEEDASGSCLWAGGCPPPSWSAFRAFHHGALKLTFAASSITIQGICGPAGDGSSNKNDITCTPGSVFDEYVIGTPGSDRAPVVTAPATATASPSTATSVAVTATDPDGQPITSLTADLANLPAGNNAIFTAVAGNGSGTLVWTPTSNDAGSYSVTFRASNALSGTAITTITVTGGDHPPLLTAPTRINATENSTLSIQVAASDPDGQPITGLTADLTSLPAGNNATFTASADNSAGILSWKPTSADVRPTPYPVTFQATNSLSSSVTTSITVRAVADTSSTDGFVTMVTDPNRVFSVPQAPRPAYQVPITEPTFGVQLTRISNDGGQSTSPVNGSWSSDARHHYQKDQPWNSDNTLLVLQNSGTGGQIILDGETYEPKAPKCSGYSLSDDRWHPSPAHSHERINVNGSRLEWFDIVNCRQTRSWTLPFAVSGFGMGEGNPSNDGRFVALSDGTRMFVVDMDPQAPLQPYPSQRIGPAIDVSGCGLGDCSIDWVSISASGKYAVVNYNGDHLRVFDVDPNTLALSPRAEPVSAPRCSGGDPAQGYIYDLGHADLATNPFDNDEDVIAGQEHCGKKGEIVSGQLIGDVVMVRLRDGAITSLSDPTNEAYPHHVSARNLDRPGWVYAGFYQSSGERFNDEIVAFKMDGSKSCQRFSHKHSVFSSCYRCESHAVPSRDGRRVLFASNWAENCGSGCGGSSEIKAYVVDARAGGTDRVPPSAISDLKAK